MLLAAAACARPVLSAGAARPRASCCRLALPARRRAIVPIGACYSITLWVGNAAYLYLSVSFIQMLKVGWRLPSSRARRHSTGLPSRRACSLQHCIGLLPHDVVQALMPVAVFTVGCGFGTDKYSWPTMMNMILVTIGVAVASYGAQGLRGWLASGLAGLAGLGWSCAWRGAGTGRAVAALPRPCACLLFPPRRCPSRGPHPACAHRCNPLLTCHSLRFRPPPAAGELNFNIVGVAFQLASIFSESVRLVLVQILLQVSGREGCWGSVPVAGRRLGCLLPAAWLRVSAPANGA